MPGHQSVYMSAHEPARVLRGDPQPILSLLKRVLKQERSAGRVPRFVGVVGFEAGRWFDKGLARLPKRPDPLNSPPLIFGDYPAVAELDLIKRETRIYLSSSMDKASEKRLRERLHRYWAGEKKFSDSRGLLAAARGLKTFKFSYPPLAHFARMVGRAKEAIARGDIYQANLSLRLQRKFGGEPVRLYRALCDINPSPYACLIKQGNEWVASCSPELLISVKGRRVVTRPIAGTRPRGKTRAKDRARQGQLLLSPKERAEHIMLVDLERNDLGRVCGPGQVRVTERFAVERYSHVMHIVSQVEGRLRKDLNAIDALTAVFPGGTITGCPKIKSIEVIQELEKVSRALFFGSAGFFAVNGDAVFNILIRTALVREGRVIIQAGAGIVADSRPAREYQEVLAKARALMVAAEQTDQKRSH